MQVMYWTVYNNVLYCREEAGSKELLSQLESMLGSSVRGDKFERTFIVKVLTLYCIVLDYSQGHD